MIAQYIVGYHATKRRKVSNRKRGKTINLGGWALSARKFRKSLLLQKAGFASQSVQTDMIRNCVKTPWLACLALGTVLCLNGRTAAADKISALIVDGQNNHNWRATTPILRAALESSGRFTVDVATSPPRGASMETFRPEFSKYRRYHPQLPRRLLVGSDQGCVRGIHDEWRRDGKRSRG